MTTIEEVDDNDPNTSLNAKLSNDPNPPRGSSIPIVTKPFTFELLFTAVRKKFPDAEKDDDTKSIKIWFSPTDPRLPPIDKKSTAPDLVLNYLSENNTEIELKTLDQNSATKAIELALEALDASEIDISRISQSKQGLFKSALEDFIAKKPEFSHVKLIGAGNKQLYPPLNGAPSLNRQI